MTETDAADEALAEDVARQISLETGLVFKARRVAEYGFLGWALEYHEQIEDGYAFDIVMAIAYRSVELTVRPTQFSGRLVRSFASNIAIDPSPWRDELTRADDDGISVTVTVDGEVVPDPRTLPDEFRQLEIECVTRAKSKATEARAESALRCARAAVSLILTGLELQVDAVEEDLTEGSVVQVRVNKYERNPVARMQCIAHYGAQCWVCDLSFKDTYGDLGAGYIHVHHRVLVSSYDGTTYVVDPIRDLVPLCPNCHMMLHRKRPPLDPAELRRIIGLESKEPLPEVSTNATE